jgi:thiosulfate dehydrogenase (quinone) large subunit
MRRLSLVGWVLVVLAAVLAVEQVGVSLTKTTDPFWTSNNWNLALVVLIGVAAVLAIASFGAALTPARSNEVSIKANPLAHFLFHDTNSAVLWLVVRVYVGLSWFTAGLDKIQGGGWVGSGAGAALKGFVLGAIGKSSGAHASVQGWYADFLNNFVVPNVAAFSFVVAFGELLVGIALIIGAFTGVAAFFGAFMNMNYMLAGTTSTNPILGFLELFLILAWRVAGYYGADRWILPAIGTPWELGTAFRRSGNQPKPAGG